MTSLQAIAKNALAAVLALLSASASMAAKPPPTLDPTYGLTPPSVVAPIVPIAPGNWIWASSSGGQQTALFRRTFSLGYVSDSAILRITGDDSFTVFINGEQVDQSTPGQPGASDWTWVHVLDIAPYLVTGVNVIAVRAVNGDATAKADAAGLLARLELPGQPAIITDESWKVSLDLPPDDWTQDSFDDSHWPVATIEAPVGQGIWSNVSAPRGWPGFDVTASYLAHVTLPVAKLRDVHHGAGSIAGARHMPGRVDAVLTVSTPKDEHADPPSLVLDFGKEVAGRLQLTGLSPGLVLVGTGESYEEATQSPWNGATAVHLIAGDSSYTPYSAFRYAKLTFPASRSGDRLRLQVALDHKYYPVQYRGSFSCSDRKLTKLWYTGAYTAHLCMQEDIWDAPKRDRSPWIGDMIVSGGAINDVFADRFLMEKTMQRLRDEALGGHVNGIPGYSCAWICTLADFHRHIGDDAYLSKQHDSLLSLLALMRGELDERGLFANKGGAWAFVDWSPGFDGNTPEAYAATHLFFVKAVREAAFLLWEMGDVDNSIQYRAWSDVLAKAARRHLLSESAGTYGDRLQENAMAVISDVATMDQQERIYESVLAPDSPAWDKTGVPAYNRGVITPYFGGYVLQALSAMGHTNAGVRLLRRYWGGMLDEGATTFWEAYDPLWPKKQFHLHLQADNKEGTFISLCHGWSAAPTSWLTEHVLGVRPTSGGFKTAVIAPDLGDLRWAEGDVPTPYGAIHVRAEKKHGRVLCRVTIPQGITASVVVPGRSSVVFARAGTFTVR
jgi:alpha-L-rhamnosidase